MRSALTAALASLFAALTALGAQLTIPVGPVPITLQTFFVLLSGLVGGPRIGFLSQLIYLLIGAAGLPVFAGLKGGVGVFLGPTAGYLLSFPAASMASGLIFARLRHRSILGGVAAALVAEAIIYSVGVPWLAAWLTLVGGVGGMEALYRAVTLGALVFLPGDALKAALAIYIATRKSIQEVLVSVRA